MNREDIKFTAKITASDTEALYDVARSKGIQMPHPALAIFHSVLAEIETPNANGVRLGEKATKEAVSTLIGTQINRNHLRTDNVLGHIIDSKINDQKEVEIVCIFFKDIYAEDWEYAQDLFKKNQLTMSFELSADVESQDKLSDGTKRLNDYYFTGAGLLFGVKPACKKARVFELAAKKLQEKLSLERQSLIFANNQSSQKSIMEVLKLMADEVKKIEETKIEEAQKVCPECNEPMKDDECAVCKDKKMKAEEVKVEEAKAEEPKAEEPKVEEAKVEEPKVEEAKVEATTVVTEVTQKVTDIMEPGKETVIVETETTRSVDNMVQEEQKVVQETTYTYAQVEEIKVAYEKQIAELKEQIVAKDNEVVTLKASVEKLAVKEVVVAEVKPDLSTGHKTVTASEVSQGSPLGRALRSHKASKN